MSHYYYYYYYYFFLSQIRLSGLLVFILEVELWVLHGRSAPRKAATDTGQENKQKNADRHPCLRLCLSTVTEISKFMTAAVNLILNRVGWLNP
jgi:hypothetical protein